MKKDKYSNDFEFPRQLLNQIASCSAGGFLLFYLDQKGQIVPVPGFESQASALALCSFANKYLEAINNLEIENIMNVFQEAREEEHTDDPEDLDL